MTKEINFYQLSFLSVTQVILNLVEKINTLDGKIIIYNSNKDIIKDWDEKLWSEIPSSWAPHTMNPELFNSTSTILVDTLNKITNFDYLIFSASDKPDFENIKDFKRTFIIFDGNDYNSLNNARKMWLDFKNNHIPMNYWQEENKKWQKKSSVNNT